MFHILLIDDDEAIRNVFQRFLTRHGYQITCAENGREGLRLLKANLPDLVITDIMMPETDGLEVVLAIRRKNKTLPVIAISGGMHAAPMDFLPLVKKFGAQTVFYKPVEMDDLLAAVKKELGEQAAAPSSEEAPR